MESNSNEKIKEIENSREVIIALMRKVTKWWSDEGYKFWSGTKFTEDGYLLASFSVSAEAKDMDDQEAFVADLRRKGYTIGGEDADCAFMVDNDNNRMLIRKVIKDRFPSARILEWENNREFGPDSGIFLMKKVRVEIRDITEI